MIEPLMHPLLKILEGTDQRSIGNVGWLLQRYWLTQNC